MCIDDKVHTDFCGVRVWRNVLLRIMEILEVVRKDEDLSKGEEADWKQSAEENLGYRVGEPAEHLGWGGQGAVAARQQQLG